MPTNVLSHSREDLETIAARFLRVSVDIAFARRAGLSRSAAIGLLALGSQIDPRLIDALKAIGSDANEAATAHWIEQEIKLCDIRAGMVLESDLTRPDGMLLLSRGQPISELAASNLRMQAMGGSIKGTVNVRYRAA